MDGMSFPVDINNRGEMLNVVNSCIATKFTHRFGTLMAVRVRNASSQLEGRGGEGSQAGTGWLLLLASHHLLP